MVLNTNARGREFNQLNPLTVSRLLAFPSYHRVSFTESASDTAAKVHARQMIRTDNRERTLDAFLVPQSQTTTTDVPHSLARSDILQPAVSSAARRTSSSGDHQHAPVSSCDSPMVCDDLPVAGERDAVCTPTTASSSEASTKLV